jgi:ribosome-associated protein
MVRSGGTVVPPPHFCPGWRFAIKTELSKSAVDEGSQPSSLKFALAAAELASNTRAEEIVVLDLRGRSPVTEFFVIATGTSPRQMRTVAEEIQDLGKQMGFKAWQTSGFESARWILVDCVNVVTHVFDSDSRDFYDLELLWGDCPRIDWRKELGLPPAPESAVRIKTRTHFGKTAGGDEMEAEDEDARLEDEEGDADLDEDAELDAPIVTELPDESTGSNSVEFIEVDPPSKRRKKGRSVYPTTIREEDESEEEAAMRPVNGLAGADESSDEDDAERLAEEKADEDVEGVSAEDLPRSRIKTRPMGGVSASMSDATMDDDDDEDEPRGEADFEDEEQDSQDEIPEMREAAAKSRSNRKGKGVPSKSAPKAGRKGAKASAVKKTVAKKTAVRAAGKKPAAKPTKSAAAKSRAKKPAAKKSAKAAKAKPKAAARKKK